MKNPDQPVLRLPTIGKQKAASPNGKSKPVGIHFHKDGSYSLHFSRGFLNLPRDIKREAMKAAVREKFRNGLPRYYSSAGSEERRLEH
jgi:hypothetical protein